MTVDLDKVRTIADRVAGSMGLEIVEIEFRGGAGKQGRILRVYIDKCVRHSGHAIPGANESGSDGSAAGNVAETSSPSPSPSIAGDGAAEGELAVAGVTHEDCANVSRELSTILDVEDVIPGGEYLLEVSSPGLDRKLSKPADFERFTGSRIKLMTFTPVGITETSKGNRHFEGQLEKFADGRLTLDLSPPKKNKGSKHKQVAAGQGHRVEIELANVERANLVPEI
jgi:ribosome maturation factor RimP